MKKYLLPILLISIGFGHENQGKIEIASNNQEAGKLIESAGSHLVKYVNSSIRNSLLLIIGNMLLTHDYEDEESIYAARGLGFGVAMIFAGTVGQITNIFKIKRAGEQLQHAGKKLKNTK
jgi:hypothetical protein